MGSNVELKARVRDPDAVRALAEGISDTAAQVIRQEDTFFHVPSGRLKLRRLAPDRGELIYYERPDAAGPSRSDYVIHATAAPETLKEALARALGVRGVVRKTRRLYMAGQTRIHLDEVEGLGSFLELEVVLRDGQTTEEGRAVAAGLMDALGVTGADLVGEAYIDLLERCADGR